jgi:hypothetical protein
MPDGHRRGPSRGLDPGGPRGPGLSGRPLFQRLEGRKAYFHLRSRASPRMKEPRPTDRTSLEGEEARRFPGGVIPGLPIDRRSSGARSTSPRGQPLGARVSAMPARNRCSPRMGGAGVEVEAEEGRPFPGKSNRPSAVVSPGHGGRVPHRGRGRRGTHPASAREREGERVRLGPPDFHPGSWGGARLHFQPGVTRAPSRGPSPAV